MIAPAVNTMQEKTVVCILVSIYFTLTYFSLTTSRETGREGGAHLQKFSRVVSFAAHFRQC